MKKLVFLLFCVISTHIMAMDPYYFDQNNEEEEFISIKDLDFDQRYYDEEFNNILPNFVTIPPLEGQQQSNLRKRTFSTYDKENPHKKRIKDQEQCRICNNDNCYTQPELIKHFSIQHPNEKPFECPYEGCCYTSFDRGNYDKHIRTHSGEKPFQCPICNQAAARESDIRKHIQTHTGKKPFKCNVPGCTSAYSNKQNRDKHIRTHTKGKSFICDFHGCIYTTAYENAFKRHMRTHTGEKPFECPNDGCDYTSTDKGNRDRHMRTCKYRKD